MVQKLNLGWYHGGGMGALKSAIPVSSLSVARFGFISKSNAIRFALMLLWQGGRSDSEMGLCCHGMNNLNEVKQNGAHIQRLL